MWEKINIAVLQKGWSLILFSFVFRSFHYLFELMDNRSDVVYTLKASYLEVYNEKVQQRTNLANNMCTCQVVAL